MARRGERSETTERRRAALGSRLRFAFRNDGGSVLVAMRRVLSCPR